MRDQNPSILFFSDIHFHNFRNHSRVLDTGVNSRLDNAVRVVDYLRDYCVLNGVRHVLFGGDLFHERGRLDTEVFNAARQACKRLSQVADLYLVVGNHDQSPVNEREHALESFRDFAVVIDAPTEIPIGPYTLAAFPFRRDAGEQKRLLAEYNRESIHVVSTHVGVASATPTASNSRSAWSWCRTTSS
jgi:DNA repair exonuclease SbcCD nuclease subunit